MTITNEISGSSGVVNANKPVSEVKPARKEEGILAKPTDESPTTADQQFAEVFRTEIDKRVAIIRQVFSNDQVKMRDTIAALYKRYNIEP